MSIDNDAGATFAAKWAATCDAANGVVRSVCDRVNAGESVSFTVTLDGRTLVRLLGALNHDCEASFQAITLAHAIGRDDVVQEGARDLLRLIEVVDTVVSQAQDVPDTLPDSWS